MCEDTEHNADGEGGDGADHVSAMMVRAAHMIVSAVQKVTPMRSSFMLRRASSGHLLRNTRFSGCAIRRSRIGTESV